MGESSFKRFSHVKVTELFKIISESSGKHLIVIPSQVSKERGFDQNFTFKILGYDLTDRTIYHGIICSSCSTRDNNREKFYPSFGK